MWNVLSLLRKCVVSQLVSSGQRLTSSFSNLTPYWGSLCSLLHPLCAWPALPVYITTLFILCFSHFQHKWEIVLGTPHQQTEKKKKSHLYCHGKQSHCWKHLFPVAVFGWVYSSPPVRLPPFLSSALCTEAVNIFWLAHMENVTFTREIIYPPVLCTRGCVPFDVHDWKSGLLIQLMWDNMNRWYVSW